MPDLFLHQRRLVKEARAQRTTGRVLEVSGLTIVGEGLSLPVGSLCRIERRHHDPIEAQIVGARGDHATSAAG